ncbi:TIGR02611 family protein [Gordonia zhaorongruii]|uniref:TIGR02611 family protein n=1 Tax=Gordonia zhaorongruii TaxID=2597659 RepID=UPI00104A37F8|nr:TIGR02611 family protein [Gordonia zhaorongruii]
MFKKFGEKYHHYRHNSRYGFALRWVTIVVGTLVTAVGVITIPYPGPGWAIVFLGLFLLSQELEWAARLRRWTMDKLNTFYSRYIDGNRVAQVLLAIATCAIVIATLWLTNALSMAGGWVGIDAEWLKSPIFG